MRPRVARRPTTFLLVMFAALACARDGAGAIPDAVTSGAWCEVRGPHVRVLSDAGIARADHVAERIERLREQLARTAPSLGVASAPADVVFLFRSGETFRDYLPLYQGRPEEDSGLYQPSPAGGFVLLQDGADRELDRVALHESTHAMLHAAIPRVPLWLDEGLAQYSSSLRVDDADARVGEPLPELVAWLRGHDLIPLEQLFAMDGASPDYHAGERRETFYAESWLLVHLLLTDQVDDRPRFDRYLSALAHGEPAAPAFRAAFGEPRQVQYRLELYLHRPSLGSMNWSFALPYSRMPVVRRERVASADVLAALGAMLRWRPGEGRSRAREHLEAALALAPDDADALALQRSLAGVTASDPVPDAAAGGESDFEREQRAIGAFNTGAQAFNRGLYSAARRQFRLAAELARRPDLVEKIRHAQELLRITDADPDVDRLHRMLQTNRRGEARRFVAEMLGHDIDPVLRTSLTRLAAALDAAAADR